MDLTGARILVVHDWLIPWGGAERTLAEILAVVPQADLIVGVRSRQLARENAIASRAKETWLRHIPFARTRHRWLVPLHYWAFAGCDTRKYDLVISSSFSFAKAVRPSNGRPHLSYCYSPPRYLWDLSETYRRYSGATPSLALRLAAPMMRALDRRSARTVTQFVGISNFVAARITRAYDRPASVIYPPVAPKSATRGSAAREDFLLVLGRLVAYKRVDLAIRAAELLGIQLVVAGDGPERQRLRQIAGPHTRFVGEVSDADAADLMERCRLFVFCAEEDFGIAPLEANAHGAPVVAFRGGALSETMVEGESAILFDAQTTESLVAGLTTALGHAWNDAAIRRNAARFNADRFRSEFRAVVEGVLA